MLVSGNSGSHLSSDNLKGTTKNDRVKSMSPIEGFPRETISNTERNPAGMSKRGKPATSGYSVFKILSPNSKSR